MHSQGYIGQVGLRDLNPILLQYVQRLGFSMCKNGVIIPHDLFVIWAWRSRKVE